MNKEEMRRDLPDLVMGLCFHEKKAAPRSAEGQHALFREVMGAIKPGMEACVWGAPLTKEQLRGDLPGIIDGLRAELAEELQKFAFCLVDDLSAHLEAMRRENVAKLRWRIDRAWEVLQELGKSVYAYDVLPERAVTRWGTEAADAWWQTRSKCTLVRRGDPWATYTVIDPPYSPRPGIGSRVRAGDGIGRIVFSDETTITIDWGMSRVSHHGHDFDRLVRSGEFVVMPT